MPAPLKFLGGQVFRFWLYQFCPTCKRDIQLAEACHHIACLCKTRFCYECGKPATPKDGHYNLGRCTLYPVAPVVPAPAVEALELDYVRARFAAEFLYEIYDRILGVSDEQMQQELDAILEDIGPHRFFIAQQQAHREGMSEDGAVADVPAGLAGEIIDPQDQGLDIQIAILSERIRLVEGEIVELDAGTVLMDGGWA